MSESSWYEANEMSKQIRIRDDRHKSQADDEPTLSMPAMSEDCKREEARTRKESREEDRKSDIWEVGSILCAQRTFW